MKNKQQTFVLGIMEVLFGEGGGTCKYRLVHSNMISDCYREGFRIS